MRRAREILLRNWPLRLGAILLATVLYTGLVLGQNVRTWNGQLPVDPIRPPAGATLLADPDPVTLIKYRAPIDVGVVSRNSFRAEVDLSGVVVVPGGGPATVPITVIALDSRIQITDFQPHDVEVQLDPVENRELPVTVSLGSVAEGLTVGPPQVDPSTVTLRGASSRVEQVSQVVARVTIDASALNVDRDFDLVALDGNGNEVTNVEIDPQRARVRIAVARQLANRTLPVVPQLSGQPALGYRISGITVEPLVVTVSGEAATIGQLDSAPTQPIDVQGRTTDLEANIGLALPGGVSVSGSDQVKVTITVERDIGTRTFLLVLHFVGMQSGYAYDLGSVTPQVILSGPVDVLSNLDPTTLNATVDLTGVPAGTSSVDVQFTPPVGLNLVSMTPATVPVVVTAQASPTP